MNAKSARKVTQSRQARPASSAQVPERETGTVRRVLLLLSHLVDNPGISVNTIASRLNLPRSTVHRMLTMLKTEDFASQESDGSFSAGVEMYRLAGRLKASVPYAKFAEPLLERLSSQFKETSILAILQREQLKMFYAATASPADPMRYNIVLHRPESLVWGATARVLLAQLTPAEIDRAVKRRERAPVDGRHLSRTELGKSLAEIRENGFAVTHSHRTPDAVGLAVPFFDADGEVVGDFGFLIPEFRFARHSLAQLVGALRVSAAAMSKQLGAVRVK